MRFAASAGDTGFAARPIAQAVDDVSAGVFSPDLPDLATGGKSVEARAVQQAVGLAAGVQAEHVTGADRDLEPPPLCWAG